MLVSQKARLKKLAASCKASSHEKSLSDQSLYVCAKRCQVIKKMRVTLGYMISVSDGNRMPALQSYNRKCFYQPVIGMRIKVCPTAYSRLSNRMYLDRIGSRKHITACFIQFRRQVVDTITFFYAQVRHIINTTRAIC